MLISLQKLSGELLDRSVESEDRVEPDGDVLANSLERLRVRLFGSIELSTVAAVCAVGLLGNLVKSWTRLALRRPLPGVFSAVGEEGVRGLNVEATLVDC